MTKEEIIEMAMLEAEFVSHGKPSEEENELFVCTDKDIVRFAKLVAEREPIGCAELIVVIMLCTALCVPKSSLGGIKHG